MKTIQAPTAQTWSPLQVWGGLEHRGLEFIGLGEQGGQVVLHLPAGGLEP